MVGKGGMGVVYAAYDPELDRKVALKLLGGFRSHGDDGQARLLREAQAMARVTHPNVTAVYDAGTYGAQVFIAMELIEGGKTLRDWILETRRSWREILDVMVEAGQGLAAAHAAGLVHRDFKPENVLVGQDGHAHVTDFGLARLARSEEGSTKDSSSRGATRGTPAELNTPAARSPLADVGNPTELNAYSMRVGIGEARNTPAAQALAPAGGTPSSEANTPAPRRPTTDVGASPEAKTPPPLGPVAPGTPGAGGLPQEYGTPAARGLPEYGTPAVRGAPADRLGRELTQAGMVVGTPSYMAPEQHLGKPPNTRSDQFSFCTTLYFALYQKNPFEARKLASALRGETSDNPASLIQPPPKAPRVPGWVKRVLMRGLAIAPEARFDSMEALLARLAAPRTTTRKWMAALVVVVALSAAVVAQRESALRRGTLCSGAEQHLQGVWDPAIAQRVKASFEATGKPYAAYTFQSIQELLDGYAKGWATMHTDACLATRVRGEQTEAILTLRMTCLDRRLKELQLLTELLSKADVNTLQHAVNEVGGLPRVSLCADVNALSAPTPPPEDALTRAEVERITTRLAQVKMQGIAGKYKAAAADAEDVARAARKVHYLPVLAEALAQQGSLLIKLGKGKDAERVLVEAWASADAARHDVVRVQVAAELITLFRSLESHPPRMLDWVALGDAALSRIGRSPESEIQLRMEQGGAFLSVGQYAEALQRLERALSLDVAVNGDGSVIRPRILSNLSEVYRAQGDPVRALQLQVESAAFSERLLGPDHPYTGLGYNNVAYMFSIQGELARAEASSRKSVAILEASLGREHLWLFAAYDTLAGILARRRHFGEAEQYALRAMEVGEKSLGPNQPYAAALFDVLASVYLETGRAKQALPLLERALKLNSPVPGVVTNLRFHTAQALLATGGDKKRARELATQALEGYRAEGLKDDAAHVEKWLLTAAR
ncbi:MAG TPA: tetratricopeptide repeat protein [Myxococcaceae bacterium]|nr:tetratricopeptide repeat protein [Myxococcaceae bacterium]